MPEIIISLEIRYLTMVREVVWLGELITRLLNNVGCFQWLACRRSLHGRNP